MRNIEIAVTAAIRTNARVTIRAVKNERVAKRRVLARGVKTRDRGIEAGRRKRSTGRGVKRRKRGKEVERMSDDIEDMKKKRYFNLVIPLHV